MDETGLGFPLTLIQRDIYLDQLRAVDSPMYNIGGYIRMGRVELARLRAAHARMVREHDAFGLRVRATSEGVFQRVVAGRTVALPELDMADAADPAGEARNWLDRRFRQRFELHEQELFSACVMRISPEEHWYCVVAHHLMIDGWGFANLAAKLGRYYHGEAVEPSVPWESVAADDGHYLAGPRYLKDKAYWAARLDAAPDGVLHPFHRGRFDGARDVPSGRETLHLPLRDYARLRALADRYGTGLPQLLLGALVVYLSGIGKHEQLVIGLPVHNRKTHALKQTIGVFTGVLPLVLQVDRQRPFAQLLHHIADQQRADYRHQRYPIGHLMADLGAAGSGRAPYDVNFNYLKLDSRLQIAGQAAQLHYLSHDHSPTPLSVTVWEYGSDEPVEFHFDYNHAYLCAEEARLLIARFTGLLDQLERRPESTIDELDLLPEDERQRLDALARGRRVPVPAGRCIHELFEAQARRVPDAIAVADEHRQVSYRQLNSVANRLARELVARGVAPDNCVGLCVERSWGMVAGLLAVLKAGGAYVPLDPAYPRDRLAYMLDDAGVSLVLTTAGAAAQLPCADGRTLLDIEPWLDASSGAGACADVAPSVLGLTPSHLAYVIYTSGSTGRPKGVMVEHRSLVNLVAPGSDETALGDGDRVLQFSSISFDAATWDWARSLTAGASLHVCGEATRQSGGQLSDFLQAHRITHALIPPAALAHVDAAREYDLSVLIVGGEACDERLARQWARKCELINAYGPTECTVAATCGRVGDAGPITIGRPLPNLDVYILGPTGRIQPIGIAGELYLGGAGLARGYLGDPGMTASRFSEATPILPGRRLYRTGDRARWTTSGEIEFLGRVDDQVKVRGYRIEPGEIEAALAVCDGVGRSVVLVRGEHDARYLVAYVEAPLLDGSLAEGAAAFVAGLQAALRSQLPEYMVPGVIVPMERLPTNTSGKIDRRALPDVGFPRVEDDALPQTATERDIAQIWSEVLGVERVGRDTSFFALGGHSLMASRVAGAISERFGKRIVLRAIFEYTTVRAQAAFVERERQVYEAIPRRERDRTPLSFAQQRLWLIDQLHGHSAPYHLSGAWRLRGPLDADALAAAFARIVQRHEALRTVFVEDGSGVWQQVCGPQDSILRFDRLAADGGDIAAYLQGLREEESGRSFDLAADLPLRARLIKVSAQEHVLLLTMHHIAVDGWSANLLMRELAELYRPAGSTPARLGALPIQYADYAAWHREHVSGPDMQASVGFWEAQLRGLPVVHGLPLDRPRPARQDYRGDQLVRRIGPAIVDALQGIGLRYDATLFMTLHAAFTVLLGRWSGESDIVVGTPVAGRTHAMTEELIGFFVNTLVLRTDLSTAASFADLLAQARKTTLDAFQHQEVPFELLVETLQPERSLAHPPLFQIMLALQGDTTPMPRLEGVAVEPLDARPPGTTAKFDLDLNVQPVDGELELTWTYASSLFDRRSIERMAAAFEDVLSAVAAAPATPLELLALMPEGDRVRAAQWSSGAPPVADACFHHLFEGQARARPDAIAIRAEGRALSYRELDGRANRLAHELRARGVGPDTLVALCLERSLDTVVAMLGVMKAGGAYVPLDPAYPDAHLSHVVNDSRAPLVLVHEATAARARSLAAATLDVGAQAIESRPGSAPIVEGLGPSSLAYAIYTSGSTGRPKGVLLEHRSLTNLAANLGPSGIAGDALRGPWALTASFAFDASVQGLTQLASGGTVVIVPEAAKTDGPTLRSLLEACRPLVIDCTPSLLELWFAIGLEDCLPNLVIGGEAIGPALWARLVEWQGATGHRAINVYGPTECCVDSTWAAIEGDVPVIGRALGGLSCHVLSGQQHELPIGAVGELYIGGAGVARGYVNRPELTASKFVADPQGGEGRLYRSGDRVRWRNDGTLEFLGRLDDQVKLRGFRIELGDIESRLRAQAAVREAVVQVRGEGSEARLVAYVVPSGEYATPSDEPASSSDGLVDALKAQLAGQLPAYMHPSAYVVLERLPLTVNGKVDKAALPAPAQVEAVFAAPEGATETALAAIWSTVLKREGIGRESNFFELGGHSLLATRIVSEVARQFGKPVPVRALFEHPTLRQLAAYVEAQAGEGYAPIPAVAREGRLPLSFAQQRLWFIEQLENRRGHYNMAATVRVRGALDRQALRAAVGGIVGRHEILRTVYRSEDGNPVQLVRAASPVEVTELDLSGVAPRAQASRLQAAAQAEAGYPFDFSSDTMLRVKVVALGSDVHALIFTLSHIAADGWSLAILVREFAAFYAAARRGTVPALPPLPIQYGDYAAWEQARWAAGVHAQSLAYWRKQLADLPIVHSLPLDRLRPVEPGYAACRCSARIGRPTQARLHDLAKAGNASVFMVLQAAFAALLSRWSGENDIVVGTPIAGRTHADVASSIGLFVNTVVLRMDVSAGLDFLSLLHQVRQTTLDAYAHQSLPFEKLVDELKPARSGAHAPLFQIMLVLQNNERETLALPGLDVSPLEGVDERAEFDLQLTVREDEDGLQLDWLACADLFESATLQRLAAAFGRLLSAALERPDSVVHQLPMCDERDARQMAAWVGRASCAAALELAHARFERQVAAAGNAAAVECAAGTLSYAGLEARANRLAHLLRNRGIGPGDRIGLCLRRSLDLPAAMLAILKAGAAYVPLDPDYPQARLQYVIEDASIGLVLTEQRLAGSAALAGRSTLVLDSDVVRSELDRQPVSKPRCHATAGDLAYVVHTSGSTGQPKGVMVSHRALSTYLGGLQAEYAIGADDRLLQFAAIGFDVFAEECFMALCHGACLVLRTDDVIAGGAAFWRFVEARRINVLNLPTAFWSVLVEELTPADLAVIAAQVRLCVIGGEAVQSARVAQWSRQVPPHVRLLNGYGPTECTVTATLADLTGWRDELAVVPIGRPLGHVRCQVLDRHGQAVPIGVAGELHLGGPALADGYLGREALTAERFLDAAGPAAERLYRTGDRVRWAPDGQLVYLGRIDEQVKVRGFRIELGEIEVRLRQQPAVADALVLARTTPDGTALVGYVVVREEARGAVTAQAVQVALREHLPDYMVPGDVVLLDAFPLTANGKVDRRALPAPALADADLPSYEAPRDSVESAVAAIWAELLERDRVGRQDDFFHLGGHSLLAVRLMSRLHAQLGVEVPLGALFRSPRLAEFALAVASARRAEAADIPQTDRGAPIPLSPAQHGLWMALQVGDASAAYHMPLALHLRGPLDVRALQRALNGIVDRHDALRTTFVEVDGAPMQVVAAAGTTALSWCERELPGVAGKPDAIARAVLEETSAPFDLMHGPLLRVCLFRLDDRDHVLVATMHHLVSDGWSVGVLSRELAALYTMHAQGDAPPLPPLPVQYPDYSVWQRGRLSEERLRHLHAYWSRTLAGAPVLCELPTDRPRPARQDFRGSRVPWTIDETLTAALKAFARRHGTTSFVAVLASWAALLSRLSGQAEVVVGTASANRSHVHTHELIGFFVNTLALRLDTTCATTVGDWLGHVAQRAMQAQDHQDLPFEDVVELVQPPRSAAHGPLFQTFFAWQEDVAAEFTLPGVQATPLQDGDNATSKFDLTVSLMESGGRITGSLEYATALFDRSTIERFLACWQTLATAMAAGDECELAALPLLGAAERRQLIDGLNRTAVSHGTTASVDGLFREQASRSPDAIAVMHAGRETTYANLLAAAEGFAQRLRAHGVRPGCRVAVALPRSCDLVAAQLAVLMCGAAYVPVDPQLPAARRAFILDDSDVVAVCEPGPAGVEEPWAMHVGITTRTTSAEVADAAPTGSDAPAYVMYTSGSTGQPKGVVVPHRAIRRLVIQGGYADFQPDDRVAFASNPAFDASTMEVWAPLLNGARIVIVDQDVLLDAPAFARLLKRDAVSVLWLTVGLFNQYAELIGEALGRLRYLLVGGDALDPPTIARFLERHAPGHLVNGYGPTETTTFALTHRIAGAGDGPRIPIGRPISNTRAYVLDGRLQPVPIGVVGEIYVGGEGVALGYLNQPALTEQRFVADPFVGGGARMYRTGDLGRWLPEGVVDFIGRNDRQVKLRGFRIELGEIDARLRQLDGIRDSVAVVREDSPGVKRLVAYCVADAGVAAEAMRAYLSAQLPDYMVPSAFVLLEALPLTANGKVDRNALPPPRQEEQGGEAAATPTEVRIAGIWQRILGVAQVGAQDNYFDLGGNSLLASRIIGEVARSLGKRLSVRALFEHPTVHALAAFADQQPSSLYAAIAPSAGEGVRPLSYSQQRLWFLDSLEGSAQYHIPAALRLRGHLDGEALRGALDAVVLRHEILRTVYRIENGEPVQQVLPAASVPLERVSLEALPADEARERVRRIAVAQAAAPFDLARDPMLRCSLVALAPDDHVLVFTMHHIASDGWSLAILVREFSAFYRAALEGAAAPLAPLPIQYGDFAAWQRTALVGPALEDALAYWRQRLAGVPVVHALPLDRARPPRQVFEAGSVTRELDPALVRQCKSVARAHGASLFMVLQAAFAALLARWSGEPDIVMATPVSGRAHPDVEPLIGLFVNTLALRTDLSANPSFAALVGTSRDSTLDAFRYQDVPYELVVDEVGVERTLAYNPLCQVKFVLQNQEAAEFSLPGLGVELHDAASESIRFDLDLTGVETPAGGLSLHWGFQAALFEQASIARMAAAYEQLLQALVADPARPVMDIPLLAESDLEDIAAWSSGPVSTCYRDATLPVQIAAQARRTPQAVAVRDADGAMDYASLDAAANRLAQALAEQGLGRGARVGVHLERSRHLLVALLGVMKSGAAYVVLDPRQPAGRLQAIVADAALTVVVQDSRQPLALAGVDALYVDDAAAFADYAATAPADVPVADDSVYVLYTSGSSGTPKGVDVRHGGLTDYCAFAREGYWAEHLAGSLVATSAAFDLTVPSLYVPLLEGRCVELLPAQDELAALASRLDGAAAAPVLLRLTPSHVQGLLALSDAVARPQAHVFVIGGEAFGVELARALQGKYPQAQVYNHYGPTETVVGCSWYAVTPQLDALSRTIPIGRPMSNTVLRVLDGQGRPVPVGVAGELYIGGAGVARGYVNRPELTASKFVADPQGGEGRLYRSGDRVRWRNDGTLEFLGRLDDQVKLRGFRIELGDIESRLRAQAAVREAVVLVRGGGSEARLVAYVVPSGEYATPSDEPASSSDDLVDALKAQLAGQLPAYMHPSAYVVLERLPLTVNGKLDKAALPAPAQVEAVFAAPEGATETALAAIWSTVLKREGIGRESNFFELGGHSLLATRIVSEVARQFGKPVPVRALFEHPTLRQLAAYVEAQAGEGYAPIPAVAREGRLPLSFAQQRLWFIDRLEGGSAQYNMPTALRLRGALDAAALQQALDALVARHEVLRTTYVEVEGEAVQVVHPAAPVALAVEDLRALAQEAREAALQRHVRAEAAQPFDLAHDPMLRVRLLVLEEAEHAVLLTMHHIASDGWSVGVLVREFVALYGAFAQGAAPSVPALAVQYADYAAWQRERLQGATLQAQLDYWRGQLAGLPAVHGLPLDRPRPAQQRFEGARVERRVDAATLAALQGLARAHDASLFMVLQAAFAVLLGRWSGESDIVVGTPIAGRLHKDVEPLIGFFVNTLVLRTDLSGNPTFTELLGQVRATALAAYGHQEVPFEMLVDELRPVRSLSHAPLFQVLLSLRNNEQVELALPGLEVTSLGEGYEQAKFDLQLAATEGADGLRLVWSYATALFEADTVGRMGDAFVELLQGIVHAPHTPALDLPMMPTTDADLIGQWNGTHRAVETACFHHLFERQASKTPDAVAVRYADETLSYRQLDARANRLAHALRAQGVGPDVLVPLCVERSLDMPVAILAVMKAGGAYVPLDPAYPDRHLRHVLDDCDASFVLTQSAWTARFDTLGIDVVTLDDARIGALPSSAPKVEGLSATSLAYSIYTSGSTGRPKGVLIEHRSLANLAANLSPQGIASGAIRGCWALAASYAFDGSIKALVQLASGGEWLIVPEEVKTDPARLRGLFTRYAVDVIDCTPSLLELWLAEGLDDCLPNVVIGGEAIAPSLWARLVQWQARCKRTAINVYGPTECCVDTTWTVVAGETPVIGRPLANVTCNVISPSGQLVPIGAVGELYIGGAGVGRGYQGRPELTASKFVADPQGGEGRLYRSGDRVRWRNDGTLEFLGRLDDQVKLRGFRIELGDIESRLRAQAAVREAVVLVRGEGSEARLVAYVVPSGEYATPSDEPASSDGLVDALKAQLAGQLPAYMHPSAYVVLERLPLTVNGKLDKAALPAPAQVEAVFAAPEGATETALAAIWSTVLKREGIGRESNFFELGGHSLLATRIVSEVARQFGKPVPVRALFEHPTLRQLAAYVEAQAGEGYAPIPAVAREGRLPLSFAQQRLWFIDRLEGGSAQYNMPTALRLRGALDAAALQQALDALVARHEVLRTTYVEVEGEAVQVVHPAVPVALAVEDLRALAQEAREAALQRHVRAEAAQPFDLAHDPMLRVRLLVLEEAEHAVLLTMHHIASDGWSVGVLVREFVALYGAFAQGAAPSVPALAVQYADYAAWQRERLQGATLQAQLDYWRGQLAGLPAVHGLPLDRLRPAQQRFEGARVERRVDAATLAALQGLARAHDASLFMVLQAAFAVLLGRWSGESDIVVGTPIAGRLHKDVEPLIGFFVNTLVLRTDLSGNPTFTELLGQVRATALAAYGHQEVPFEMLVDELRPVRSLSHAPLFQVLLSLRNNEQVELALPGLEVTSLGDGYEQAKFDLQLAATEGADGLRLVWSYATALFEADTVGRMGDAFVRLLQGVAGDPQAAIHDVALLAPQEGALLQRFGMGPASTRYRDATLPVQIAAQARRTPQAVAVRDADGAMDYASLDAAANRLAQALRGRGLGRGARVGVHLERSRHLLVALLGVMKSGAAYVVLDPRQPAGRLQAIVADAALTVVVQDSRQPLALAGVDALYVDDAAAFADYAATAPADVPVADDSVYVLYTSGSSGTPKGVDVRHGGLTDYCAFAREGYWAEHLAGSLVATSAAFDLTVPSLYVPLLEGRCVELLPAQDELAALATRLDGAAAAPVLLRLTPSHVQGLLALSDAVARPQAHVFVIGGEAFGVELARALQVKYPQAQVYNHYGPTETVVGCSWYAVTPQLDALSRTIPIGRPMSNTVLRVLDGQGRPVPVGVAGELYIGGAGVARGYVNRPELTASKFVADPQGGEGRLYRSGDRVRWRNDGTLEFLGRLDDQVKLRGFRIELGDIESRLRAQAAVREAVVLVRGGGSEARLVAYVVPSGEYATPSDEPASSSDDLVDALKAQLAGQLPAYMHPSAYVVLERLPLTVNGKLDKAALPAPVFDRAEYTAPATPTEIELAVLWQEALGREQVSVTTSFFDLGGHSLLATRLINAVRRRLDVEVPIRAIFEKSDIRSIAIVIDEQRLRQNNMAMAMEKTEHVEMEW